MFGHRADADQFIGCMLLMAESKSQESKSQESNGQGNYSTTGEYLLTTKGRE